MAPNFKMLKILSSLFDFKINNQEKSENKFHENLKQLNFEEI